MTTHYAGGGSVSASGNVALGTMPRTIEAIVGVFLVLSWIAVALRVYVRAWMLRCFGMDDWLMVVTLVRAPHYDTIERVMLILTKVVEHGSKCGHD